jgi:hypothetical protein
VVSVIFRAYDELNLNGNVSCGLVSDELFLWTLNGGLKIHDAFRLVPSSSGRVTLVALCHLFPLNRLFVQRFGFWNAIGDVYDGHLHCLMMMKKMS